MPSWGQIRLTNPSPYQVPTIVIGPGGPTLVTNGGLALPGGGVVIRPGSGNKIDPATAALLAAAAGAAALAARTAVAVGTRNRTESRSDPWMTFYHGTGSASAVSLLSGAPLSLAVASSEKKDGPVGFYLATTVADAEYFAARRPGSAILTVRMRTSAYEQLVGAGSLLAPIPGGPRPVFAGVQFYIPPAAFSVFDLNRAAGNIELT
jgi:hypothetical protein